MSLWEQSQQPSDPIPHTEPLAMGIGIRIEVAFSVPIPKSAAIPAVERISKALKQFLDAYELEFDDPRLDKSLSANIHLEVGLFQTPDAKPDTEQT